MDELFDSEIEDIISTKRTPAVRELAGELEYRGDFYDAFNETIGSPDKKKIIGIIRKEPALITGELISTDPNCKNPRHCVVGALFAHAGMSDKRLKEMQSRFGSGVDDFPLWAHQILWRHYRLTPFHTYRLIDKNDSAEDYGVEACTVVNKSQLIDLVKKFDDLTVQQTAEEIPFNKHIKAFLTPLLIKTYRTWALELLAEQQEKIAQARKRLRALKAKKK